MKRQAAPTTPAAWIAALRGWPRRTTLGLVAAVRGAAAFAECVKWGNLAFVADGPAVVLRAEPERVLFILLRGQRLQHLEPRLQGSGKFELATLVLREGDVLAAARARRLARAAAALNQALGDPTKPARSPSRRARRPSKASRRASRAPRRRG